MVPVLVLWMQISKVNGQQIKQIPQFLALQEGEDFSTYCNSSTTVNGFQWYEQKPGGRPVLLMIVVKVGEVKKEKRLTFRFGETRKDSSLHITAAQIADVGTYFCAETTDSWGKLSLGAGTQVVVIPGKSDSLELHLPLILTPVCQLFLAEPMRSIFERKPFP